MSLTVGGAFSTFRTGTVDLDPTWTSTARGSRDYLFSQLRSRATADATFPRLTGGYINFGSFARRTKIRPLDDIDMMPILNGTGTSQYLYSSDLNYWLRIDSDTSPLARFNDGYGYVNSTKVLNAIRNSLGAVHNYRLAVIKKTMQAVTLQLSTYSWVFDIVPAVGVSNGTGGTDHYLIPDGRGNWIRTDPRIDQSNLTTVNQRHTNYFIPTLRLLKYWNMKRSRRRLPSYYFETLVMRVLEYATPIRSYSDAIDYFFRQCPIYLALSCPDPKGLGPALDSGIDITTRQAVKDSMSSASGATGAAMLSSRLGDEKAAIGHWGRVFGAEFPTYG